MERLKIISVRSLGKYKLEVLFNDGTEGTFDLSVHANKGVFKAWEEDDNFNKVQLNNLTGAISWPGEIDIDTLQVYFSIKKVSSEEYFEMQKNMQNISSFYGIFI